LLTRYFKLSIISLSLIMFFFVNVNAEYINPSTVTITEKTGKNAAIRSALFPGLGQFFLEDNAKGYIFSIAAILGIAGSIVSYNEAESIYNNYSSKSIRDDKLYDDYLTNRDYMYYCLSFAAVSWISSILDAYISGNKYKKNNDLKLRNKRTALLFNADKKIVSYNVKF
jgi:hypothetical protein